VLNLAWPWLLLALPLPLLAYWLLPPRKRQSAALRVPFFGALAGMGQRMHGSQNGVVSRLLLILVWCLLVLAAARPQWVGAPVPIPTEGRDLMLAVDMSGSMEIPDMVIDGEQVPRVLVIKQVVGDFVERRTGDRLGLIIFGTRAYLHAPLTFDRATV
jgi:Ca-activated chloride channel family protein